MQASRLTTEKVNRVSTLPPHWLEAPLHCAIEEYIVYCRSIQQRHRRGLMALSYIGEFEQMILLAVLQQGEAAYAIDVRKELERTAGRSVSRGALYRTFDRLEAKGYIDWELEDGSPVPDRGGHPMRKFRVTDAGLEALRVSRSALLKLWRGLDAVLDRS